MIFDIGLAAGVSLPQITCGYINYCGIKYILSHDSFTCESCSVIYYTLSFTSEQGPSYSHTNE